MILNKIKKDDAKEIISSITNRLNKDPLFMYYSPDESEKNQLINDYFNYYLYKWADEEILLISENKQAIVTLRKPRNFQYKFYGKNARQLKKNKTACERIFRHQKIVRSNVHLIASGSMNPRVLNIYGSLETNADDIANLIDEAIAIAQEQQAILVYETLSLKMLDLMAKKGFNIGYQKGFYNTKFIQTLMIKFPVKIQNRIDEIL